MERVNEIECLNIAVQQIMKSYFQNCVSEYQMSLLLFRKKSGSDGLELIKKQMKAYKKKKICSLKEICVTDRRIGSDGSKKQLYWVMASEKKCWANEILASIILDEVAPKFLDMVHLETLGELKLLNESERKTRECYYYDKIMDFKWLLERYVEEVIERNGLPDLVNFIQLSMMPYEGRYTKTLIFFSENPIPYGVKKAVYFEEGNDKTDLMGFKTENLRLIRKLMEVSGEKLGLWVRLPKFDVEGCVGADIVEGGYAGAALVFGGHSEWSVLKGNESILEYREGKYIIPTLQPEKGKYAAFEELEQFKEKLDTEKIRKIVLRLSKICQHGTSIVFMDQEGLNGEIDDRLFKFKRALKVKPFSLLETDESILEGISAIDGALFASLEGECYAIGVIVDGKIESEGNYSRGARYNSLKNYVSVYHSTYSDGICMAVVLSEDGMINILC